jgi:hypothetical protein
LNLHKDESKGDGVIDVVEEILRQFSI